MGIFYLKLSKVDTYITTFYGFLLVLNYMQMCACVGHEHRGRQRPLQTAFFQLPETSAGNRTLVLMREQQVLLTAAPSLRSPLTISKSASQS